MVSTLLPGAGHWPYVAMAVVVFAAAVAQGVGGIGFAMFVAPVAAMFFPELAPGPLLAMGGFVSLLAALRERAAIDWRQVGRLMVGRGAGTVLAVYIMTLLSPRLLAAVFASVVLLAVLISISGWRVRASGGAVAIAGLASGVMGTLTSVGAPPLGLVLQNEQPARLRATVGAVLAIGSVLSLSMLAAARRIDGHAFLLGLGLLPFLMAGFVCSSRFKDRLRPALVRRVLLACCAVGAMSVFAKLAFERIAA